ncbi:MAG: 30S ribosome-binding factor RbfA [Deltaproteobacteria bacterium]|nr:30S ribosome-binding factor RbfA [Deltaproteobacteria bacterium]
MIRFKRAQRVGGQVQKELSELLLKEIRDPRLHSVTIMHVNITDNLRLARVFFSTPEGQEQKNEALAGFKSASGYLRRELSQRLELRYMPALEFLYDEGFERATNINKVLKSVIPLDE